MRKRLLSLLIACCMLFGVLPWNVFARPVAAEEEELYMQMLSLGLSDENGKLIEDNTFTLENGMVLQSLAELEDWLAACTEADFGVTVTVGSSGKSATAREIANALSLEYRMADIASQLDLLASGALNDATAVSNATVTPGHEVAGLRITYKTRTYNEHEILDIHVILLDGSGNEISAPCDIKMEAGLFYELGRFDLVSDPNVNNPARNRFSEFSMAAGKSEIIFSVDISSIRTVISGLSGSGPVLWDGVEDFVFMCRITDGATPCARHAVFGITDSATQSPIVRLVREGGKVATNRGTVRDAYVATLNADDKDDGYHTNTEVTESDGYLAFTIPEVADSVEATDVNLAWERLLNQAVYHGVGDEKPMLQLTDVSIVGEEGSLRGRQNDWEPRLYYVEDGTRYQMDIAYESYNIVTQSMLRDYPAYGQALAAAYCSQDTYNASGSVTIGGKTITAETFYNQLVNDSQIYRFTKINVPFARGNRIIDPIDINRNWQMNETVLSEECTKEALQYLICTGTYKLLDSTAPTIKAIHITGNADATYYPGDRIPITVEFSEPVTGDYKLICASGDGTMQLASLSDARYAMVGSIKRDAEKISNTRTFMYEVQGADSTRIEVLGVTTWKGSTCADVCGNAFENSTGLAYQEFHTTLAKDKIISTRPQDGITAITAAIDENDLAKAIVTVEVNNSTVFQNMWADLDKGAMQIVLDGDTSVKYPLEIREEVTGENKKFSFYTEIPLAAIYGDTTLDHTAELYINEALYYGKYASFTQHGIVKADKDAYKLTVDRWPSGVDSTIFLGDGTMPQFTATVKSSGHTYTDDDQFYWVSSDPAALSILNAETLADGHTVTVVPGKVEEHATVKIYLMSKNGSTDTAAHTLASNEITVTVKEGDRPILSIPQNANTFLARYQEALTVRFSSNLTAYKPENGGITAALYEGETASGTPVWTTELARNASGVTIPAEYLTRISAGTTPSYTLTLSASAVVDSKTLSLETTAYILVRAQAAKVTLAGLENPQFTADQEIPITWTVENYDVETNPDVAAFQFLVEKDGEEIARITDVGGKTADMIFTGSYTLRPTTPAELKETYIVTVKAKNSTDPTWSTASSTITVYKPDALRLLVGGEDVDSVTLANRVSDSATSTNPTVTSYAGTTISGLTDAYAIAGLRSELCLIDTITVDTAGADWSLLDDRIRWETTTGAGREIVDELNRAVTINYKRGSLYEPLERFTYTAYLPQIVMLLSGIRTGTNIVTATHNNVDTLKDSVQVNVERLRDQLYLFQFTPAVETTLHYTDKKGVEHTVTSNEDGSLALYEPNGIASSLQTASIQNGVAYRGTFSALSLKSGEGDGAIGELYPLNALSLRLAAMAEFTLLNPDGTPYANQNVFLRGGVYRNRSVAENRDDAYCADAMFAKAIGDTASLDGKTTQTFTTDGNGVLRVYMDLAQFTSANDPDPVGVGDMLEFVFEARFADTYKPEIITVNGSLTARDAMRSGDNIVTLRSASGEAPFIAAQKIDYHTGRQISVRDHTGVVGPSANYPEVLLETTVMLWGTDDLTDTGTELSLRAQETAVVVPVQDRRTVQDSSYPFSSIPLVTNVSTLNADTFAAYTAHQKTSMEAVLYRADGSLWQTIPLPFGLVDMNAIEKVEESPSLLSLMTNLAIYGRVGGADTKYDLVNAGSDFMFNDALSFLAKMGGEAGLVRAVLMPTEDPTRFSGYFWTGINTTKLEDLSYDEHGISVEPNYMWQDLDSCIGQVNDTFTVSDFQAMADGSYFDDRSNLYGAASSAIGLPIMLVLEGFLETEIRYNFDKGQWEVLTTGGGFTAGGQLEYEKAFNIEPFGIPIFTVSIKVRGGATVDFKTAVRYAEQLGLEWNDETARAVNDYLTALRINAYFEFFGGVGHDKGYTAKIGVFGTIEINNDNWFLTRKYLKNTEERDLKGQFLQLNGEAGIRAALGLGPVVTEITVVSLAFQNQWRFNSFEGIKKYWDEAESGLGGTGYDYTTETESYTLSAVPTYTVVQEDDRVTITDYSVYLQNDAAPIWVGGSSMQRAEGFVVSMMQEKVRNAIPLANPYLNDDGSMLLHLWKNGSANKVYCSDVYMSEQEPGKELPDGGFSGYGDSALSVDGTSSFTGAVWLRESATLDLAPGSKLNEAQQTTLLNGLEVMVSLWNGSTWQTTRLTDNATEEISPVIAVNDAGKAIAAWREVQSETDPFTFSSDRIVYRIYNGTSWSDQTYTLYNGSSGGVTSVAAEMLSDGTAAIAYSLDDGEVYYAVLHIGSENPEDDTRVIRATTNQCTNDSAALAKVEIDGAEMFVLGWRSVQELSGAEEQDVGLRVFDKNGAPRHDFPESLSDSVDMTAFDGKFTIVSDTADATSLSILWNDAGAVKQNNDVIRAVKIGRYGDSYGLSAPLLVQEMPENTVVDHMDAYSENDVISTLILATTYSKDKEKFQYTYTYTDEKGEKRTYTGEGEFPKEESAIYLSVTPLSNQISVDALTVDYTTLAKNALVPVNLTVKNDGYDVINALNVTIDGGDAQTFAGLALLPGKSTTVSVIAKTGDTIRDMPYTVTASFTNGDDVKTTGTLYLDYPDVGISRVQVTSEQDGVRTILATLYNQSPVAIDNGSRRVVLGVYSNPECTDALDGKYFTDGTDGSPYTITVSGDALAAIDNGGYAHEIQFNIQEYVRDAGLSEIPAAGVTLFVAAKIEKPDGSKWQTMPEADVLNNQKNLTLESLLTRHDDLPVTTTVETTVVETAEGSTTIAKVTLRNNSLNERPNGVLIVSLLAKDGTVLETIRYDVNAMQGEESIVLDVPFTKDGDRVIARYSEVIVDDTQSDNADAAVIAIDGLPLTIADFDENGNASVKAPSGKYLLTVIPAHKDATVSIDGESADDGTAEIRVPVRGTTVTVTITAPDGVTKRTYTISLTNDERNRNPIPDFGGITANRDFCRITFQTNGGTRVASIARLAGTWIDLSGFVPTREGYVFDGWYLDAALTEPVAELRLTKDVTLYAAWKQIGAPAAPADGIPFVDVAEDDWFYSDVRYVYEKSLMNGTAADRFTPYGTATRAMMATVLWRMAGSPTAAADAAYSDVSTDAWYAQAVAWTTENGIFNGYGDGTFQPDTPVTREQLAAIFHRYAAFTGSDTDARGDLTPYVDSGSVSEWAVESIRWAIGTGLMQGKGGNTLDPIGQATRAEIAAILHRFIGE